jgi:hypothetical protein
LGAVAETATDLLLGDFRQRFANFLGVLLFVKQDKFQRQFLEARRLPRVLAFSQHYFPPSKASPSPPN